MTKFVAFLQKLMANQVISRALHTFWQAFFAAWVASNFSMNKVALIASVAAGFSAFKTFVMTTL